MQTTSFAAEKAAELRLDPKQKAKRPPIVSVFIFGILLPAAALLVELATGMASEIWVDPIPTPWHILLIAWVPVANSALLYLLANGRPIRTPFFLFHGLASGISFVYWIAFFPWTFFGLLLFWTGIGLLPLAPFTAFISTIVLRGHTIRANAVTVAWKQRWISVLAGVGILLLLEIPSMTGALGLTLSANGVSSQRDAGQTLLGLTSGNREMVRYAAGESGNRFSLYLGLVGDVTGLARPSVEDAAREIYRSTGQPVAKIHKTRWGWDAGRAGTRVGSILPKLSLAQSTADAVVNPAEGCSYTEWTMSFRNDYVAPQEARCEVLLPPGGVVSRLTLWVNGEEREAAFAGSAQVREAYTQVVARQQDPVLVTAAGPGRVLVQCFPVLNGKEMKIRFGITAPLLPETAGHARFVLPSLTGQNFTIKQAASLKLRGPNLPDLPGLRRESDRLEGEWDVNKASSQPEIILPAPSSETTAWHQDTRSREQKYIVQKIHPVPSIARNAIFIVDGSAPLAPFAKTLSDSLARFPQARVILATGREPRQIHPSRLNEKDFIGGADNVLALIEAARIAASEKLDTLVWIHGPQPELLTPIASLNDKLRYQSKVRLISLPMIADENELLRQLDFSTQVETHSNLRTLLRKLTGAEPTWVADYSAHETLPAGLSDKQGSSHLVRLWAAREVAQLISANQRADAVDLGQRHQLVTAVTGAVVLETAQQYKNAGLTPVNPTTVPNVPEPTTWALLLAALLLTPLLKRRAAKPQS